MTLRTFSYGGGVQSTAALVLAAQGEIDFQTFLFADPGSEHPRTIEYVNEVARPFGAAHGIEVETLVRVRRDGSRETLRERLDKGRMAIPVRRTKDGKPMSRSCTSDFKIRVVDKWLAAHGATPANPADVGLGISVDEMQRAKGEGEIDPVNPRQRRTYPLLTLGFNRGDCEQLIRRAGLPVPGHSACYFCPLHGGEEWRKLRAESPELFDDACDLEAEMSKQTKDGRPVFLTRRGIPLREVFSDQLSLLGDDCESGYCMT